jgi:hypothetical protein
MKIIFNSKRTSNYASSLTRELSNGTILKNINFQITGVYSYNYVGGSIYYQNCTFTGGTRVDNYSGSHTITSAPDNAIDTLIKNTNFDAENKLITFDPHKQKYKPTYTLIPLASSGYYDINENDLINLSEEEKKNINIPVLNETRAITDLRNFKITL